MFLFVLQTTIVSIIFIYVTHSLFLYFRDTMTVPKIKDLVNSPTQKYENMYNIISNNSNNSNNKSSEILPTNDYTEYDLLPKPDTDSMKNELKTFLKQQLNNSSTDISTLDSSTKLYSDF